MEKEHKRNRDIYGEWRQIWGVIPYIRNKDIHKEWE